MQEDSQNNEALIQEMLRDAKTADLPSDLKTNPVISRGDGTLPAPMTVKEISGSGYVWVWDSRTYEKIPILYYMLPSKLRQRREDGSFRFTTTDPGKKPTRGAILCMLHKDGENREGYDALGFRHCKKSNITNAYQLTEHMRKKHPQEWNAIKAEKEDREKVEDRELQRMLLKSQIKEPAKVEAPLTTDEKPPLYVSKKDKK